MILVSRRFLALAIACVVVILASHPVAGQRPVPPEKGIAFYPSDGSSGVWAGTSISGSFDRAVNRASLEAALVFTPSLAGRFNWYSDQGFEFRPNEPLAAKSSYQAAVTSAAKYADGSTVFKDGYRWSFSTGEDYSRMQFGYGIPMQVVKPKSKLGVQIEPGFPRSTLGCVLYQLDTPGLVSRYDKLRRVTDGKYDIDIAGLTRVAEWNCRVDSSEGAARIYLPDSAGAGAYVLEASSSRLGTARALVVATNHALVAKKGSQGGLVVWASSVPEGAPAASAELRVLDSAGNSLATSAADGDGVGRFDASVANAGRFVVADVNGELTLVGLDANWYSSGMWWPWWGRSGMPSGPPEFAGHIHTDRPIYRPGHTVHYKASLRHFSANGFEIPAATQALTVTIRDAAGNAVSVSNPTLDRFGTVAGDLDLSTEAALGNWSVVLTVKDQDIYGSFQVQDYVKPDYEVNVTTDRPYYVRGDTAQVTVQAKYYFGQPVAEGEVTVRVYRSWYWRGEGNKVAEVKGVLDAQGKFTTGVLLGKTENNYAEPYFFEAEVVDDSRRPVVSEASVMVHPALFDLQLQSEKYGLEQGEPARYTARVMDHDGQPVAGQKVVAVLQQYVRDGMTELKTQMVTTGADGTAQVDFGVLAEGWFSVVAKATDSRGNEVIANSYAWIYSVRYPWYWWGGLEIAADRESYAPGDEATLLIKSPVTTTALVTLERDQVHEEIVVPVSGATAVKVPIKAEYAPNVWAKVQLWQPNTGPYSRGEGTLITSQVEIKVPATDKRLRVDVSADAGTYKPGEKATFRLKVNDAAGRPVLAQLSLAVVDKAVLALAADTSGDAFDAFWGSRQNGVMGYDTLQIGANGSRPVEDARGGAGGGGPLPPGSPQPSPTQTKDKGADQASQATPRRYFPDTAYWNATIETDANGEAVVSLDLPDTLTTWAVLARAISLKTEVGQGKTEVVVTKDLQADPALPRFAVQGDEFALDVLARNYSGSALTATCSLESPGLVQLDPGPKSLDIGTGQTRFGRWSVVAGDVGTHTIRATVTSSNDSDTIELPLTVQAFAVPDRSVESGSTEGKVVLDLEVPFNAVPEASTIKLNLTPGVAVGILDGLDELIGYPYGCVEQTMSRMYPNAIVGRLVKQLGISAPKITDQLPELMSVGLQKLSGFQNSDGSWGWWHGDGNLYITAYVLHGLTLAEAAGFDVDAGMLQRGFTWLETTYLQGPEAVPPKELWYNDRDPRFLAYAAYVLAQGGHTSAEVQRVTREIYANRAKLDPFALGALTVALQKQGLTSEANQALNDLVALADVTPTSASWPIKVDYSHWDAYYWRSMASTEKNTAMALHVLAQLRPKDPLLAKASRWLMDNRWQRSWYTTQGTAFAVLALTDYLQVSGELQSDYSWQAQLDGQPLASGQVTPGSVTQPISPVVLKVSQTTPGKHSLTLTKQGTGSLFYTIVGDMARYYDGFQATKSAGFNMTIQREYQPVKGRSDENGWHVGDLVNVRLTVETKDALAYMLIEDNLPAGFEALNEDLATDSKRAPWPEIPWRWWGYERKEVHDDRVSFFLSTWSPGTYTFEYAARAVTPGTFSARPAEAYAMYRPEVWARSESNQIKIAADRIASRPYLAGDFNRDCQLSAFDAQLVAADWAGKSTARDLDGDRTITAADITLAASRAGKRCGDALPSKPANAGEKQVRLRVPEAVAAGQTYTVDILASGAGTVGGYEFSLSLPAGTTVVDTTSGDALAKGATVLGPSTSGTAVRVGAFGPTGASDTSERVIGRLTLMAGSAGSAPQPTISSGQIVRPDGATYTVKSGQTIVSPPIPAPSFRLFVPKVSR